MIFSSHCLLTAYLNTDTSFKYLHQDKRIALLEKIVELYRGDLLERRDYADYLSYERDRCKRVYEVACLKLSALYLNKNMVHKAENILKNAIAFDPYSEDICLTLIRFYKKQGKITRARKTLIEFKNRLKSELDLDIDESFLETVKLD